ncbi:MAG: TerB family tellurite resistance protein [Thermoleophilia bacterium]|nr:TerB family tellurite resistance protein [Thermoleophilia bacterium]
MRGNKTGRRFPSFLERRRSRQGGESARDRAYTLELASLHLQLLVAMAAVDEQVAQVEVEEVLAFIDRTSMPAEDLEQLEQLARTSLASPPNLDQLTTQLHALARRPAIARLVALDLARVAAADSREDPRETRMLTTVCEALDVPAVEIRIDEPALSPDGTQGGGDDQERVIGAPAPRAASLAARHRARVAVRKALEASYREDADGHGTG